MHRWKDGSLANLRRNWNVAGADPLDQAACYQVPHPACPSSTSLRDPSKVGHFLKCRAASPLCLLTVKWLFFFSWAALRCQTAGSACSKWYPSTQKHFRGRKNTRRALGGTFKLPLYKGNSVLWREAVKVSSLGAGNDCSDGLGIYFCTHWFFGGVFWKMPYGCCVPHKWGDCEGPKCVFDPSGHLELKLPSSPDGQSRAFLTSPISDQWLESVTLRSSMPLVLLPSFLFFSL